MSKPQLRVVHEDGSFGKVLPDFGNLAYLDDTHDPGTVAFDYPRTGKFRDLLLPLQEIAIIVDGKELPNSRFRLEESAGNTISDNLKYATYSGQTLLGRLDEALVLPEKDTHARDDVVTDKERELLQEQRKEWMQSAVKEARREAERKAKEHNDRIRDRREATRDTHGGAPGGASNPDLNRWGERAVRWARAQISNPSQNWYRMCQSFVRQSFGLPGIYGTAAEAWMAGTKKVGYAYVDIPGGVPVYWAPNHVALSTGGGMCISTDILRSGQVDEVTMLSLGNDWGLTFRGWSTEVSGRRIYP